ncbi:hypothetical protein [Tenacibaculum halocynthiae]|uniref:hypothetical protein n=1 Tax=Tenacibaculum halocynthiae TaxID=1254437 RepID=UPI003894DCED
MNKKNIFQKIIGIFKSIFCKECTYEECIESANENGVFCYKDEGRTKEMLSYSEIIEMLKSYDMTRIEPIEKALGYEDSRINTFDFIQFKKYLGHIENLSRKVKIEITGISFIATAKPNHKGKEKGYGSLIYMPSTTIRGKQVLFDPVQSAKRGELVTFKEMLVKHGYNWIYDSEGEYKEGKRKDYNYSLQSIKKETVAFSMRNGEGNTNMDGDDSGAGNLSHKKPPYA